MPRNFSSLTAAEALQVAISIEQRNAEVLIIQLDTPGGDIQSLGNIIQAIRASTVPVVIYVAPNGAMAGSAGALVTMAGQAAAMAPEAAIGASSPVGSGGQDLSATEKAKVSEIEVELGDLEGAFTVSAVVDTNTGEVLLEANTEITADNHHIFDIPGH